MDRETPTGVIRVNSNHDFHSPELDFILLFRLLRLAPSILLFMISTSITAVISSLWMDHTIMPSCQDGASMSMLSVVASLAALKRFDAADCGVGDMACQ